MKRFVRLLPMAVCAAGERPREEGNSRTVEAAELLAGSCYRGGLGATVQSGPLTARAHMGKQCAGAPRVGGEAGLTRGVRRRNDGWTGQTWTRGGVLCFFLGRGKQDFNGTPDSYQLLGVHHPSESDIYCY